MVARICRAGPCRKDCGKRTWAKTRKAHDGAGVHELISEAYELYVRVYGRARRCHASGSQERKNQTIIYCLIASGNEVGIR